MDALHEPPLEQVVLGVLLPCGVDRIDAQRAGVMAAQRVMPGGCGLFGIELAPANS